MQVTHSVGKYFTQHFSEVFENKESSSYKKNQNLTDFCDAINSVTNAGSLFKQLTTNSANNKINGKMSHLRKSVKKITQTQKEIIDSIEKAKSREIDLSLTSKTKEKIEKKISKAQKTVDKVTLRVMYLTPPAASVIETTYERRTAAMMALGDLKTSKSDFLYLVSNGYARPQDNLPPASIPASNYDFFTRDADIAEASREYPYFLHFDSPITYRDHNPIPAYPYHVACENYAPPIYSEALLLSTNNQEYFPPPAYSPFPAVASDTLPFIRNENTLAEPDVQTTRL